MPWDEGWGGGWGSEAYLQGYDLQAKQSTRYLARGASITACNTDASQYLTNLSVGTSSVYENTTTRFNRGGPRTIGFELEANNTDTGAIWSHGTGANRERITWTAANTIEVMVNAAAALTYTVTGLGATRDNLVIAWVTEANPDTTGASDAMRSWLMIWNTTDGTFDKTHFTHAAKNLQSTTATFGALDSAGTTAFSGTITAVWWENRAQSASEIAFDWVAAGSEPASEVDDEEEHQGLPPDAGTIDSENYHHGPAALWCADATRRLYRRTLSPLWNEVMNTTPSWTDSTLSTGDPFMRGAPDDVNYRMCLGWLRVYPVSDTCNALWVRVHLVSSATAGAAVPLGVRIYSWNRPPGIQGLAQQGGVDPLESYYLEQVITRDDTGNGEWTVMGIMPIARGTSGLHKGLTYLCLALQVDPAAASANDANALITVNAVNVVPCFRDVAGGLQFAEGIP